MSNTWELLAGVARRRFWSILTVSLLLFVAGTFLWYSADSSETYFKQYRIRHYIPVLRSTALQIPWWYFDLEPGSSLLIPLRLPVATPAGQWFIDVLGHPVDSAGGVLSVNGHAVDVDASGGAYWHRIRLNERPEAPGGRYALRYEPTDPSEVGGRFRLLGTYSMIKRKTVARRPMLVAGGQSRPLPRPEPVSFRRGNLEPGNDVKWRRAYRSSAVDPFFRIGVRTQLISLKWIGDKLILAAAGVLGTLLLISFAAFTIKHPASGLAVLLISLAALWLRWTAVESLADHYERSLGELTVRHNLWWDSAAYFFLTFRILSNQTPAVLGWPIGMPTFSSYLFHWGGLDLAVPKYGFAVLQAMVGPALYFACRRVVHAKFLAFVPLILWSLWLRPLKYSYYYLTESTAMYLMIAWIAILVSRDPTKRGAQWPWVVVASSILFVLSGHSRDIIITFFPAFLAMIWLFAGGRASQRLGSAAGAVAVVVLLWCANPLLFANKSLSLDPFEFLAITPSHYQGAQKAAADSPQDAPSTSILGTLETKLGRLLDDPRTSLGEVVSGGKRFWNPEARWTNLAEFRTTKEVAEQLAGEARGEPPGRGAASVRAAYENSTPARYLLIDTPAGGYGLLLKLTVATAIFGLVFSPRWRAVGALLAYVTLFQVLLYPNFTSRPRAIFFPVIVLFASLGVFAAVEQFPPWLRAILARGRRHLAS